MLPINELWSLMGALALLQTLIPPPLRKFLDQHLQSFWTWLSRSFNRHTFVEVHEDIHSSFKSNLFYREVELYLSSLHRMHQTDNLRVHRSENSSPLTLTLPPNETIEDTFNGAQLWWTHYSVQKPESQQQVFWNFGGRRDSSKESRSFSLKLFKTDRARILSDYFDKITKTAKEIERLNTQRKLFTNDGQEWEEVDFKHPSTFDTLALVPELKERIKCDLKAFAEGEDFYHSVGRAWKRGYLLYGPPGTGKSSMIAAMANFLQYDVYDLELTSVSDNSELKSLLIRTSRKSIIVIEDIDCSLDLSDRAARDGEKRSKARASASVGAAESQVTLSGLLNFTDGLWSCCGEERLFVFTTNHKERLDPALLRSGRMDFHILLSYCTFPALRELAANYLRIEEHEMYASLEEAMRESRVTPAEVVELLISNKHSPDAALKGVMAAVVEAMQKAAQLQVQPPPSKPISKKKKVTKAPSKSLRLLLTRLGSTGDTPF